MVKVFHFFNTGIVLFFLVVDTIYGLTVFLVCDVLFRFLLCIVRLPMTMFILASYLFSFISGNRYLRDKTSDVFGFEIRKLRGILMSGLANKNKS